MENSFLYWYNFIVKLNIIGVILLSLWFYLDKISILLGLVGSLASCITFFLALKVKSNVSKIIGKLEFKNEFDKLSGQTESYLKLLDNYEKANLNRLINKTLSKEYSWENSPEKIHTYINKFPPEILNKVFSHQDETYLLDKGEMKVLLTKSNDDGYLLIIDSRSNESAFEHISIGQYFQLQPIILNQMASKDRLFDDFLNS